MYLDIISYELADGITEERLFEVAKRIHNEWMQLQPGFISWNITKELDGGYTDIVAWEQMEDAKRSETTMGDIKDVDDWMGCYKPGSIKNKNLQSLYIL